jgi:leucyl/phenylalanyl-tRNA---protein transferase
MVPWLSETAEAPVFPATSRALGPDSPAPGLLAAGGCLNPTWLHAAYRRGIFPWFGPGEPLLWWSTSPRMVLQTANFKLHRSLRKTLLHVVADSAWSVTVDHAFDRVIGHCASTPREGQGGTWIVPEMVAAYGAWHRAGQVHAFETWHMGTLVGGLYGVSIGDMFFGESMFSLRPDASKIALAALVAFCRQHGVAWIDCQQQTRHLASLGAAPVSRSDFEAHLASVVDRPGPANWTYDRSQWALLDARLQAIN